MLNTAIHLLRCKAEVLPQGDALAIDMPPIEVIEKSLLKRPTTRVSRGSLWHIGNTRRTKEGALAFALGRDAVLKAQEFDENSKEFRETEKRHAPFTIGVFDPKYQTLGILIRQGVSLSAKEIADKIQLLLESAGVAREANRRISVDFIPDPSGFMDTLRSAHRITRFEFSFSLPNPPDDEKYIQRPLKAFAQEAGANEGKASIRGSSLNAEPLIELAGAIASTGDDATANVQSKPGAPVLRKRLGSNSLRESIRIEEADSVSSIILSGMRRAYSSVRGIYDRTER